MEQPDDRPEGEVLSVRGSVVDMRFSQHLPAFYGEIRAGEDRRVVIEVVAHLSPEIVRGMALTPTAGLSRGSRVIDTGHTLRVPVGERLLGRVLNVFGEAIDGSGGIAADDWRPLHGATVPLARQAQPPRLS